MVKNTFTFQVLRNVNVSFTIIQLNRAIVYDIEHFIPEETFLWYFSLSLCIYIYIYIYMYIYIYIYIGAQAKCT